MPSNLTVRTPVVLLLTGLLTSGCVIDQGGSWDSIKRTTDDDTIHISLSRDGKTLQVWAEGEIEVGEQGRSIARMAPGSQFKVRERIGFKVRTVRIRPDENGALEHKYFTMGLRGSLDTESRAWIDRIVPEALEESGLGAVQLARELLEQGGVPAVLARIAQLESDYAKAIYFRILLDDEHALTDPQPVLTALSTELNNDNYKAELLRELVPAVLAGTLDDRLFLDSTASLSDYYRFDVTSDLVDDHRTQATTLAQTLESAQRFDTEYYQVQMLDLVANHTSFSLDLLDEYLSLTATFSTEYHRVQALHELLRHDLTSAQLARLIEVSATFDTEYHRVAFLEELPPGLAIDPAVRSVWFAAVEGLDTEHHRYQLIDTVADLAVDTQTATAVLDLVDGVSTDHNRLQLLLRFAPVLPADDTTLTRYVDIGTGIDSDYTRAQAYDALLERNDLSPELLRYMLQSARSNFDSAHYRAPLVESLAERLL